DRDNRGHRTRGSISDSAALPALWADLDIAGPGHKTNKPLPPDEPSARSIITEAGLPDPSVWIHSGGGLYPIWLLDQPHPLDQGDNLAAAETLSTGWQQVIGDAAERLGWTADLSAKDLARILRIPGTVNRKVADQPAPCRIVDGTARRFTYAELVDALAAAQAAHPPAPPRPPAQHTPRPITSPTGDRAGDRPGDDYTARTTWPQVLEPRGWRVHYVAGEETHWTRPGKDTGTSATTNWNGTDRIKVFSDAAGVPVDGTHSRYEFVVWADHGGDFASATRALAAAGYGAPPAPHRTGTQINAELVELAGPDARPFDPGPEDRPPRTRPRIDITFEPEAMVAITDTIAAGTIPDTYVKDGHLVHIVDVSGARTDQVHQLPKAVMPLTADGLRLSMARHAHCYRIKKSGEDYIETPAGPAATTCRAILTATRWDAVPPLAAIIGSPVIRPDGSILQDPGYDPATWAYYDPRTPIERVPDTPTPADVAEARALIVDQVLGDFCWVAPADLSNYIALLMTPLLRPMITGHTPLGAISATERGSGKTLLTTILGVLYGMAFRAWTSDDEELRKFITTTLLRNDPVVLFDNVADHDTVASPILAALLTGTNWDDRLLGTNQTSATINDRLWLITGNNVSIGGDIASRTVLVRLDPRTPRPDLRADFRLGPLDMWLQSEHNRAATLRALLILARDWVVAGTPTERFTMRTFSKWAQIMGGFLRHHGLDAFLANAADLEEHDDEAQQWETFLATWHAKFGTTPKTAWELLETATPMPGVAYSDPWSGRMITRANGALPSARGLGKMLAARKGRFFGQYKLVGTYDSHTKVWYFAPEIYTPGDQS
ncbi:MAG TPA: hypothetical protein VIR27_16270, partial [Mycobacteriales bacterium]